MMESIATPGVFMTLAVLLGLVVGVSAASTVDTLKLKITYKLGYWRGRNKLRQVSDKSYRG